MDVIADRKASVALELQAGQFKAELTTSEAKVAGLDRSVDKLDRSITKIPPDAAKAALALKLLGTEATSTGRKVGDVGVGSTTSMSKLGDAVSTARGEVRKLADEFNRTGDVSVLGKLFNAQKDLKALEGLQKRVSGALQQGAADGGREAGQIFAKNLGDGASTSGVGSVLIPVLVGAAVLAAPAMSAALMGAAGLGGIGLGVAGQFRDPQVHAAFVGMGRDLMSTLTADTGAFKAPLIGAAHTFGDALKDAINSINFGDLAKDIGPLVAGLAGLLSTIMPGLNKLFAAAGPILSAAAQDATMLGSAVSTMFDMFAAGGKGAQESLRALLSMLAALIVGVGAVVLALSKVTEWSVATGEAIGSFVEKAANGYPLLQRWGNGVKNIFASLNGSNDLETAARAFTAMGADAGLTADDMDKLAGSIDKVTNNAGTLAEAMTIKVLTSMMGIDQANLSVAQSLNQVSDAIKENGRQLDIHTEKGQANRSAILSAVQANIQQYQALVASGVGAADAAAAYDQNTAALERQLQKAGLTAAQIDGLIGKYRGVPGKVQTDIATNGLTEAINGLADLIREINGLPTRKSVEVFVQVHDAQLQRAQNAMDRLNGQRYGGIRHAAMGMIVAPRDPGTLIGEPQTGGEALIPLKGISKRRAAALGEVAMSGYGLDVVPRSARGGWGGGSSAVNLTLTLGPGGMPSDRALAQIAHAALRNGSLQLKAGTTRVTVG